ncbi:unnamed protein product [Medioppia subpectinata]|uniref:C2H2-type domain-containing protein n=1 Tax=Medioppia subpectinata TaxID=1979941 RepID=A0A7R9Q4D3_9ACAR|nr:unnamed protein product [Medioppia subpectinata]CAG2112164.1 unnamed protein product [Medioppia subpectinata]
MDLFEKYRQFVISLNANCICPQNSGHKHTWNQLTHIYHTFTHDIKSFNTSLDAHPVPEDITSRDDNKHSVRQLIQTEDTRSESIVLKKTLNGNKAKTTTKRKYTKRDKTSDNWPNGKRFRPKVFVCEYTGCERRFRESEELVAHIRVRHTMERPFGCDVCHKTFPIERYLRIHQKIHAEDSRQVRCEREGCDKSDESEDNSDHKWEQTLSDEEMDDKNEKKKRKYVKKIKTQTSDNQKTTTTTPKRKYIKQNKTLNDTNGKRFRPKNIVCEYTGCERRFRENEDLVAHIRVRHTMERPFECDVCHKTFVVERYLRSHQKIHTEPNSGKKYGCSWPGCEYVFRTKQSLSNHMLCHQQLKQYACDECDQRFNLKASLQSHKKSRHSNARPYVCDWPACEATYKYWSTLHSHKQIHLGVKQFMCDIEGCGKGFVTKHYLYQHKRQHLKPFACSWPACDQRFGSNDKLVDHMNAHQGLRVVDCPVEGCNKTFTCKPSARHHLKQVHNYASTEGVFDK